MTDDIPERILETPDSETADLIPAIADKLGVTVSMLRSQPEDVLELMRRIYIQTQHDDSAFRSRMQQVLRMQDISPLRTVELTVEQNANCIDGVINNLPLPDSAAQQRADEQFTFTRKRLHELQVAARLSAAQISRAAEDKAREEQEAFERKQGG